MALSIIDWKRTPGQYIAILQSLERFDPQSIREIEKNGFETVLGGTLRGTTTTRRLGSSPIDCVATLG